jgi:hypothetical protein
MPKWSVVVDVAIHMNFPAWYKRYVELHRKPYYPGVRSPNMATIKRVAEYIEAVTSDDAFDGEGPNAEYPKGITFPGGNSWTRAPSGRPVPPGPPSPRGAAGGEESDEDSDDDELHPGIGPLLDWVQDSNRAPVPLECHGNVRVPDEATISDALLLPGLRSVQTRAAAAITGREHVTPSCHSS